MVGLRYRCLQPQLSLRIENLRRRFPVTNLRCAQKNRKLVGRLISGYSAYDDPPLVFDGKSRQTLPLITVLTVGKVIATTERHAHSWRYSPVAKESTSLHASKAGFSRFLTSWLWGLQLMRLKEGGKIRPTRNHNYKRTL